MLFLIDVICSTCALHRVFAAHNALLVLLDDLRVASRIMQCLAQVVVVSAAAKTDWRYRGRRRSRCSRLLRVRRLATRRMGRRLLRQAAQQFQTAPLLHCRQWLCVWQARVARYNM